MPWFMTPYGPQHVIEPGTIEEFERRDYVALTAQQAADYFAGVAFPDPPSFATEAEVPGIMATVAADAGSAFSVAQTAASDARYRLRNLIQPTQGATMFSIDDGRAQNAALIALHEALNQRITLGIVSDWIGQTDRLTSAQVLAFHQAGHEIANHSKTHANYTGITAAQRAVESDTCSDWIEALVGVRPQTFIYPQGAWNATTDRELYTRFRSWAATVSSGTDLPLSHPLGSLVPRFYRLDLDNPANLDRALGLVRLAAVAPVLVCFYTHWTDQPGTMTTAQYQSIAQLAADLGVPCVQPRDALGGLSRLQDPSFEIPSLPNWSKTKTGAAAWERVADTPDAGISGGYVLELTATNPDSVTVSQSMQVSPGKWRLSGRVKQLTGGSLATNDFGVRLKYRAWDESAISQEVFFPAFSTGSWGRFEQDFTVPDGTLFVWVDLLNLPGTSRGGTLRIDHVDHRPTREGGLG